jgi:hypothetical protein
MLYYGLQKDSPKILISQHKSTVTSRPLPTKEELAKRKKCGWPGKFTPTLKLVKDLQMKSILKNNAHAYMCICVWLHMHCFTIERS